MSGSTRLDQLFIFGGMLHVTKNACPGQNCCDPAHSIPIKIIVFRLGVLVTKQCFTLIRRIVKTKQEFCYRLVWSL